jgi:DNA-binding NarL/FixJ family response regulator
VNGTADASIIVASAIPERRARWSQDLADRFKIVEVMQFDGLSRAVSQRDAGVLLLDLAFPELNGAAGVAELHRLSPTTRILIIGESADDRLVVGLLRAGAAGCCAYDADQSTLHKAVDFVAKGQMWVSRTVIAYLLEQVASLSDASPETVSVETDPRFSLLTERQRQIVALIGTGASNREIATRLHVTEKTVKAHLTSVFRRLGVSDRLQLALLVTRRS